MSKVQIAVIIIAVLATILAVLVFSGALPGARPGEFRGTTGLLMWGTLPEKAVAKSIQDLNKYSAGKNIMLRYQKKSEVRFEDELLNAWAKGEGPDLIIFPAEFILKHRDKLLLLSQDFLTERNFRDTFVDGADILIFPEGIVASPLIINPLVLYWNRDLFRNESIAVPPKTWDEFLTSSQKLTKIDAAGSLIQSGAALGVTNNVAHFKEILSLLILQTGNPIVDRALKVTLSSPSPDSKANPAEEALRFFIEFANPRKASYSWTSSLPLSRESFVKGTLAMYFGFASEFQDIRAQNPHLNFDLAPVPQIRGGKLHLTYGSLFSVAISRQAKSPEAAWEAVKFLVSTKGLSRISEESILPPARRDLIAEGTGDPVLAVLFREAVKFRAWLDKDAEKTRDIFANMIQSAYTGRKGIFDAVHDAQAQLNALYAR